MKGCAICNGDIHDHAWPNAQIAACRLLIATDGGTDHLRRKGLAPPVIFGDMDSGDVAARTADESIEQIPFPQENDQTDAEDLLPGTRGNSNVLRAPEASIRDGGGLVLVYLEREGQTDA